MLLFSGARYFLLRGSTMYVCVHYYVVHMKMCRSKCSNKIYIVAMENCTFITNWHKGTGKSPRTGNLQFANNP